jgi:hypothetical protein
MTTKYSFIFIALAILALPSAMISQTKFEREFRVEPADFPAGARSFAEDGPFDRRIKWLKEESQDGITYEAKTRYNRAKYSIEFDTLGNVIDVEKTIKVRKLDDRIRKSIEQGLQKVFARYKISKVQEQWKADDETLLELIRNGRSEKPYERRYEVIVKARKDEAKDFYEVLLTPAGETVRISKIVYRTSQNLEF